MVSLYVAHKNVNYIIGNIIYSVIIITILREVAFYLVINCKSCLIADDLNLSIFDS